MTKRKVPRTMEPIQGETSDCLSASTSLDELQLELDRRIKRFSRWADKKSKEEVTALLAAVTLLYNEKKKRLRYVDFIGSLNECFAEVYKASYLEIARKHYERIDALSRAGRSSHANRPEQIAKAKVHQHWIAWQNGTEVYKNKASFARDMAEKYNLLDTKNIEEWCRRWRKRKPITKHTK